ncbi:MAG: hypothetical protein COV43_06105 [Deltaproteobacteria bacterium CG11_big_fil_rev_8_21_14_0_20_42_23]|nr:MAG: hypothetical protein COV43_06105 [Deltaproteobacteria bacterium CG11_big_fil_rev_8_21_14_0_20_42_23]PJC65165.1 MAG: hypothetical protein CO021_00500 [Deltaproteobacteria bacterium CG_4_9_14_0_2_um_filter_42_21]
MYASFKRQEFNAELDWYVFETNRLHLQPKFKVEHQSETNFELLSADARMAEAWSYDNQVVGMHFLFGPQLTYTRTLSGPQQQFTRFVSGIFQWDLTSHDFEYFLSSPQSGYQASFALNSNAKELLSDLSIHKLTLSEHKLWNLGNFSPALFVLGLRGSFSTSITDTSQNNLDQVPPNFLYYLGGSNSLRGFTRAGIPNRNQGALTASFLSLELRLAKLLPLFMEPIFFADIGAVGDKPFTLDKPFYFSPGFGLRIASPIGVFRGTFAKGIALAKNNSSTVSDGYQFYLSFGEEF